MEDRVTAAKTRGRDSRRHYWTGWALRQGAMQYEAQRVADALERQLQSGRAPGMADQWRILRWHMKGAA
jgi:hypothetical protein